MNAKLPILLTGALGQLGREMMNLCRMYKVAVFPVDLQELDISDESAVNSIFRRESFSAVVNAAAFTAVDLAEKEIDAAFKANRDGPGFLARACAAKGIPLIHISTDYVFNGEKNGSYLESDDPDPRSVYGRSKLAGEELVRRNLNHIIFRTSWVFSSHGKNFVKTILHLARERVELRVIDDQKGCPTSARDLARAIMTGLEKISSGEKPWGTYHFCNSGETTWYGFACQAVDEARSFEALKVKKIFPISTEEYPSPAHRPKNSVFCCDLFEEVFNSARPDWRQSLAETVRELYHPEKPS